MLKTFTYGNVSVVVRTNIIKDGVCYFGEKNIAGELEAAFKEEQYITRGAIGAPFLINIYKRLKAIGIAPVEVSTRGLVYPGTNMVDYTTQTKLVEEKPVEKKKEEKTEPEKEEKPKTGKKKKVKKG